MGLSKAVRKRQSQVSKSGSEWETYVQNFVNSKISTSNMEVIGGKDAKNVREIFDYLSIRIPGQETRVWGDIDLLLVRKNGNNLKPLAVISCKTSIRERLTQTLFYRILLKDKVKFYFATRDKKWGTPERPNKARSLSRAFLDGVYVENNNETSFGDIVKRIDDLPNDIKNSF